MQESQARVSELEDALTASASEVCELQEAVAAAAERSEELHRREAMVATVHTRFSDSEVALDGARREISTLTQQLERARRDAAAAQQAAESRHAAAEAAVKMADESRGRAECRERDAAQRAAWLEAALAEAAEGEGGTAEVAARLHGDNASLRGENERLFEAMQALSGAQAELQDQFDSQADALKESATELEQLREVRRLQPGMQIHHPYHEAGLSIENTFLQFRTVSYVGVEMWWPKPANVYSTGGVFR
jgi:chromosome segregation ATPase